LLFKQSLTDPDASRLQRRYQKHRQSLFVFLYRSEFSQTNNVSERALGPLVVHRKVIGCLRSKWGAYAHAALATVIDTAELNGIHAFAAIQSLFGRPSLPLPLGGELIHHNIRTIFLIYQEALTNPAASPPTLLVGRFYPT
jgi:hypothetical protein